MAETLRFQSLLRAAMAGSVPAACEVLEQYGSAVIVAVRRALAPELRSRFDSSDFAQAVWASFFTHPSRAADIDTPQKLIRLLTSLARHKVVDEYRRRCQLEKNSIHREKSFNAWTDSALSSIPAPASTPSQFAIANELWERLLNDRTPQEQMILKLRRIGFTSDEIAERLEISERTVRRFMSRAFEEYFAC